MEMVNRPITHALHDIIRDALIGFPRLTRKQSLLVADAKHRSAIRGTVAAKMRFLPQEKQAIAGGRSEREAAAIASNI
jgi:hypothetical protein